jgi:hypothetical protein
VEEEYFREYAEPLIFFLPNWVMFLAKHGLIGNKYLFQDMGPPKKS